MLIRASGNLKNGHEADIGYARLSSFQRSITDGRSARTSGLTALTLRAMRPRTWRPGIAIEDNSRRAVNISAWVLAEPASTPRWCRSPDWGCELQTVAGIEAAADAARRVRRGSAGSISRGSWRRSC